jgi:adenine-specific DNA-methyltransferase
MRKGKVRLGDIADIHVGITTLADKLYIMRAPRFAKGAAIINTPVGERRIEADMLRPIIKASVLRADLAAQERYVIFPYQKQNGKHAIIPEARLRRDYPLAYDYFLAVRDILAARDKGRPNPVAWFAFGRSQGLDTSFGEKILTAPMNAAPRFIVWKDARYTFYSGYCIKFDGDLQWLAAQLNSPEMAFYINLVSRDYQNNYKSFAKSFIADFYVAPPCRAAGGVRKFALC